MRTEARRPVDHWQAVFDDPTRSPDPIFHDFPQLFIQGISKKNSNVRRTLLHCIKIIKESDWRNELSLIMACILIEEGPEFNGGLWSPHIISECDKYFKACTHMAGGKDKVQHNYHFKAEFIDRYLESFTIPDPVSTILTLLEAIQCVERILPKLPQYEQILLGKYQLQLTSTSFYDPLDFPSIDLLKSQLPQHLREMSGTALSPAYSGPEADLPLLRILCLELNHVDERWISPLVIYALLQLADGQPQDRIVDELEILADFSLKYYIRADLSVSKTEYKKFRRILSKVESSLSKSDALVKLSDEWEAILTATGLKQTHEKLGWIKYLKSWHPGFDFRFIAELWFHNFKYDDFLTMADAYLWKWRGTPHFEHLVMIVLSLANNQEHRPASAMRIVRGMRKLFELVALKAGKSDGIDSHIILEVVEEKTDNPELLQQLALAYAGAWRSQQTYLTRVGSAADLCEGFLLPQLPRTPVFGREIEMVRALRRQMRRAEIDVIAEHWEELHRWVDHQLVALRAVMLAFHKATWNLDPRDMQSEVRIEVDIPGLDETWHFTIWTAGLFQQRALHLTREFPRSNDQYFMEYRGASGSDSCTGLWCADLFRAWLDPEHAAGFESTWGRPVSWLQANNPGVLSLGKALSYAIRPSVRALKAQGHPTPSLFCPHSVSRAALFGGLAMRLLRYGGHRGHEILQLRTDKDHLFVHESGGYETVLMKFFPKGHKGTLSRPSTPSYNVVSESALRLISALQRHVEIESNLGKKGSNCQTQADYVFNVQGNIISVATLNTCLRFLAFNFEFFNDTNQNKTLNLTSHRLRHAFANNMIRSGVDISDLSLLLNHKNLEISEYYSQPTVLQQKDNLARVARQSGMWPQANDSSDSQSPPLAYLWPLKGNEASPSFEEWVKSKEIDFKNHELRLSKTLKVDE